MNKYSYLLFDFNESKYGIKVDIVREIFYLPELTCLSETPKDILGIINLRGAIVPIMHLGLRLNYALADLTIDDSIIVINWQHILLGILVNSIENIVDLDYSEIETNIDYGRVGGIKPSYIAGISEIKSETIILLNYENLVREPQKVTELENISKDKELNSNCIARFHELCQANISPKAKEIFQNRAKELKLSHKINRENKWQKLACFLINREYYGVDLNLVKEFTVINQFTPVPYSPNYIVGNCNWRGEILTLVDVRHGLNLPIKSIKPNSPAIIVASENNILAIAVDQIFDVANIVVESIQSHQAENKSKYIIGTIPYQGLFLNLIDVKTMINDEIFIVKRQFSVV